jgi:hypothetical protein
MALSKYTKDTAVIANVGTKPEDRTDLTDETFKAKWDENATDWKTFFNNTASVEIDALITAIKGAGWTSESLKGLADLISTLDGVVVKKNGSVEMTDYLRFSSSKGLQVKAGDVLSFMDFDFPEVATTKPTFRIFRATNTTADKDMTIHKGDGTSTITFQVRNGAIVVLNEANVTIAAGSGSPEGVVTAPIGSIYLRTDGVSGTAIYTKDSGIGNTGWSSPQPMSLATNISGTSGTISVTMNGSIKTITPSGDCTFNATGGVQGQRVSFVITTTGSTSRTLTFGTNFKTTGTLATGATTAKKFVINFIYDGTVWCETARTVAM